MHGALFHLFGSVACHYSSARLQHSWHVHAGFRCRIIIAVASVPIQIFIWRTVTSHACFIYIHTHIGHPQAMLPDEGSYIYVFSCPCSCGKLFVATLARVHIRFQAHIYHRKL